jgi:hypothetical protein
MEPYLNLVDHLSACVPPGGQSVEGRSRRSRVNGIPICDDRGHNLDLHFFTSEQLKAHDLDIATKMHQATVASVMRRVKHMNSGQILNASRENGRVMLWTQEKIEIVLQHIGE